MRSSNLEFFEAHARPGCVGLVGGTHWTEKAIRLFQRRLRDDGSPSPWSHVVLFEGKRQDGRHWLFEADVDWADGRFLNGIQENPIDKYADARAYPCLAVMDFGLPPATVERMIVRALDLTAQRVRYDFRGLLSTYLAIRTGRLARSGRRPERRLYCSAFIQYLYREAGIRFAPGVAPAHTTPEHIARTEVPHKLYSLLR